MLSAIYPFLPETLLSAVEKAVQQTTTEPVIKACLLSGGLSEASVFRIDTETNSYLLKILPEEGTDLKGVLARHKLASAAGVAPELYYANDVHGILITAFINSQPISSAFSPEQAIIALAKQIKTLHNIEYPAIGEQTDLKEVFDKAVNSLADKGFLADNAPKTFLNTYAAIKDAYPWNHTYKVLSHNDLNPRNILCDGSKLWLVDWDVSSINDRYVDLAMAAHFFVYTPDMENLLLNTYFAREPSLYQLARFRIIKPLCRLVYAEIFLQMVLKQQSTNATYNTDPNETSLAAVGQLLRTGNLSLDTSTGQWLYGKALLNAALQAIEEEAFKEYISTLQSAASAATSVPAHGPQDR
ncbi:phosphotransferase [Mucilaginibacter pedocola]|uniref:Aminoglycoside phosphotransferase domain-containing protein n=1 Tax=Mucilaginibacter pedocola TaxID=1792845 RepID=A0A1S9PGW0_9SPHI|nr:phosphotransferase [Mucilaginibacter pedocola]OOQ60169.1 hypothetical protein BC343_26990 [Mucilaginibacter pedocola]